MIIKKEDLLVNENEMMVVVTIAVNSNEDKQNIFDVSTTKHRTITHFNFAARTVKSIHNIPQYSRDSGVALAMVERAFSDFDSLDEIKEVYARFKAAGGKARPELEEWLENEPRPVMPIRLSRQS